MRATLDKDALSLFVPKLALPDGGYVGVASSTEAIGISADGDVTLSATTAASVSDKSVGALSVAGGVGIAGDVRVRNVVLDNSGRLGIEADVDLVTLAENTVTVAGSVVATGVDVNGDADVSGSLILSGDVVEMTHSGSTSLSIVSTDGTVTVENVTFDEDQVSGGGR